MTARYIHIGYPKNLSTTLQRDFFDKHPAIRHLGIGCGDNIGYRTQEIARAVEGYLQYCRDFRYAENLHWIKEAFEREFELAEQDPKTRAVGISLEHLSFSFTPDNIDTTTKAYRLRELFGKDTRIIMIIREQMALLRSLYRECVRTGYPGSFNDYMEYAWKFQDRSFLYDFAYDRTHSLYCELFGEENVLLLPIERYLNKDASLVVADGRLGLLGAICEHLELSYEPLVPGYYNVALSGSELVVKRELNRTWRHDLGNMQYASANTHRLLAWFEQDLDVAPPRAALMDVKTKRLLIEMAQHAAGQVVEELDYRVEAQIEARIRSFYAQSNAVLQERLGLRLDYPLADENPP